jgi:hypothetical protein
MSAVIWILLAIVYVACWIYFGMATFRKGHYWMFWIGFIFPLLWIIGAFMTPHQALPPGRRRTAAQVTSQTLEGT